MKPIFTEQAPTSGEYATKADLDHLEECCVTEFKAIATRLHHQNYMALALAVEHLRADVKALQEKLSAK